MIKKIYTDQSSISFNSGIHTIVTPQLPPQIDYINNYMKADVSNIWKALDMVNWEKLFCNKNIDIKVSIFNETILNTFINFVPNKVKTCNEKDPVWMNEKIKSRVKSKNQL